jgi:CAAX protease family protein
MPSSSSVKFRYLSGIAILYAYLTITVVLLDPSFIHSLVQPHIMLRLLIITRLLFWVALPGLWLYARYVEKGPFLVKSEKDYPTKFRLLAIVILLAAVYLGGSIIGLVIHFILHETTSIKLTEMVLLMRGNYLLIFFVAATAGITEEMLFRGYIQSRFEEMFRSHWPPIILTSILFGVLHLTYGTVSNAIIPFYIGLIFSWFYWKYRNIRILIIVHFLIDLFSLLVLVNKV